MSIDYVNLRFLVRGGTAANLEAVNEVPMHRELVIETDTGRMKLGNGTTTYNALEYISSGDDYQGWLSGTAVPSASLGKPGDLYFRTTTGDVYLRGATSWAFQVSLRGPAGVTGAPGAVGPKGDKGDTGEQGEQGVPGLPAGGTSTPLEVVAGVATADLSAGDFFALTLDQSASLAFVNEPAVGCFLLQVTNQGSHTLSLPGNVHIVAGVPYVPSGGSGLIDVLGFARFGGGTSWSLLYTRAVA